MYYTMKGNLNIFPISIYVNNNSMANILSHKEVENSFRVTMNKKEDHAMLVHFNKYKAYRFKECENGLYYLDISDPENCPTNS